MCYRGLSLIMAPTDIVSDIIYPTMIQTKQMKILVVNHQDDCNAERFQSWLEQAGFQIDNRLGPAGELPDHVQYSTDDIDSNGYCAMIITGSNCNIDDEPSSIWWFPQVEKLVLEAVNQGMPTLGLCLGCQLVAHALGGRIDSCHNQLKGCTKPYGFGATDIHLNALGRSDRLFDKLPETIVMHENHQAYIQKLPDGAELLASSNRCPVEAFRYGRNTYGLQFHPEVSTQTVKGWKPDRINTLVDAGIDWQQIIDRADENDQVNLDQSWQICQNFIAIIQHIAS